MSEEKQNGNGATPIVLPAWKHALKEMRANGLTFGKTYDAAFFENIFGAKRHETKFAFQMISLRKALEDVGGDEQNKYYMASEENGARWIILETEGQFSKCDKFSRLITQTAKRTVSLRSSVLDNPAAQIADADRRLQESRLERDATRLALLSRSRAIADYVSKNKPKLIGK